MSFKTGVILPKSPKSKPLKSQPRLGLKSGKYVKWMTKLRVTLTKICQHFFGNKEMAKLEKNMNKTGKFLTSIKKEVATMTPYITAYIC